MSDTSAPLPLWRRLRRRFYWALLAWLLAVGDLLPLSWLRRLCVGLAGVALRIRSREVETARRNLAGAFPERSSDAIEALVKECGEAAGLNLFHALAAGRILRREDVEEAGPPGQTSCSLADTVAELLKEGRGVFFLTGHIGSWELLGTYAAGLFSAGGLGQLGVVTGVLHNPPLDRLVQQRRRRLGMAVLPRDEGVAPVLRHLKEEGLVAFLLDQNTRTRSRDIPFFGRPAPTPEVMARLALKKGIPVLPLAMAQEEGKQRVTWLAPLRPEPVDQVEEARLTSFLTDCNRCLEELIRRNPAHWVWFHRRWKH